MPWIMHLSFAPEYGGNLKRCRTKTARRSPRSFLFSYYLRVPSFRIALRFVPRSFPFLPNTPTIFRVCNLFALRTTLSRIAKRPLRRRFYPPHVSASRKLSYLHILTCQAFLFSFACRRCKRREILNKGHSAAMLSKVARALAILQ